MGNEFLCEDLVLEILSWAPVKTLIRFRCVSKSFNRLISDPHFVKLHLQKSATNEDFTRLQIIPRSHCDYFVVGSCNGLVCVVNEIGECGVYLWNMAMQLRSNRLPSISSGEEGCELESVISFGFGHDPLNDTYKVVALLLDFVGVEDTLEVVAKVYSFGHSSWRDLEDFPNLNYVKYGIEDGVYLRGTLNWIAIVDWHTQEEEFIDDELVIISLDLGKETCRALFLPDGLGNAEPTLGVLRDTLCLWQNSNTHFVIWQMKEFQDHKSWTQLLNVAYFHLQIDLMTHRSVTPLHMYKNGDVVLLSLTHGQDLVAIFYNHRKRRLKRSGFEYSDKNIVYVQPKVFIQSLVMPY